jgi:hypothetical protein
MVDWRRIQVPVPVPVPVPVGRGNRFISRTCARSIVEDVSVIVEIFVNMQVPYFELVQEKKYVSAICIAASRLKVAVASSLAYYCTLSLVSVPGYLYT